MRLRRYRFLIHGSTIPKAVYLSPSEFGAHGDGNADDSAAIQAPIDKAGQNSPEGIVFVPSGPYRLTRTVHVWPGVRVFGYGATRPLFLLADHTPRYKSDTGVMVTFTGFGPGQLARIGMRVPFPPSGSVPPNPQIADTNPGTFYSAMSNVDSEIGNGNDAAVAVRFHVAQHSYLSHMDFHIGSGLAGLYQMEMKRRICISTADATAFSPKKRRRRGNSRSLIRPLKGSVGRRFGNSPGSGCDWRHQPASSGSTVEGRGELADRRCSLPGRPWKRHESL